MIRMMPVSVPPPCSQCLMPPPWTHLPLLWCCCGTSGNSLSFLCLLLHLGNGRFTSVVSKGPGSDSKAVKWQYPNSAFEGDTLFRAWIALGSDPSVVVHHLYELLILYIHFFNWKVSIIMPASHVSVRIKAIMYVEHQAQCQPVAWARDMARFSWHHLPQTNPQSSSRPKNYFNRRENWHPEMLSWRCWDAELEPL